MSEHVWERKFSRCGAFWRHDKDLRRPFARLTSGKISDGFFDAGKVLAEHPDLYGQAATALVKRAKEHGTTSDMRVIGAALGAISLAQRVGEAGHWRSAFAEKTDKETLEFKRFAFQPGEYLLMVEDTVTTGKTLYQLEQAARVASEGCTFFGHVLAICDRTETGSLSFGGADSMSMREGRMYQIISLIRPCFQTWDEGENPYTGGKELVPPLRPKEKNNWHELCRSYE